MTTDYIITLITESAQENQSRQLWKKTLKMVSNNVDSCLLLAFSHVLSSGGGASGIGIGVPVF